MRKLFQALQEMNWVYGKGDIESIEIFPTKSIQPTAFKFTGFVYLKLQHGKSVRKFSVTYGENITIRFLSRLRVM